jgi:hypothetical protein
MGEGGEGRGRERGVTAIKPSGSDLLKAGSDERCRQQGDHLSLSPDQFRRLVWQAVRIEFGI